MIFSSQRRGVGSGSLILPADVASVNTMDDHHHWWNVAATSVARIGRGGAARSQSSSRLAFTSTTSTPLHPRNHILLHFEDPRLEDAYVVYEESETIAQMVVALIGGVVLLLHGLLSPNSWVVVRVLYWVVCLSWLTYVAVFVTLQAYLRSKNLVMKHFSRLLVEGRDEDHAKTIIFYAKTFELLATISLGINSILMASFSLGRWPCWDLSLVDRQHTCYNAINFEPGSIMALCVPMAIAPVRVPFFAAGCVSLLLSFILANVFGPPEMFLIGGRFAASVVLFTTQLSLCVVWMYLREERTRSLFCTRLRQEVVTQKMERVRRITEEAALRRLPEQIVRAVSHTGTYKVSERGIVLALSISNFVRWCRTRGRGPSDVVQALTRLTEAYLEAIEPLFHHASINAVRMIEFGETIVVVVFPEEGGGERGLHRLACERTPLEEGSDALQPIACIVWTNVIQAMTAMAAFCCSFEEDVKTPMMSNHHASQQQELLPIAPTSALSVGVVAIKFIPKFWGVVCVGEAVDECCALLNAHRNRSRDRPIVSCSSEFSQLLANKSDISTQDDHQAIAAHRTADNDKPASPSAVNVPQLDHSRTSSESSTAMLLLQSQEGGEALQKGTEHCNSSPVTALLKEELVWSCCGVETFVSGNAERIFVRDRAVNFDLRQVNVNACSMLAMSAAMIVICIIQGVTQWAVRSPLPFCIGALLCGGLLLFCCHWSVVSRRCSVLEGCYWLFMMCCMASSVMADQYSSIFGASLFPWTTITLVITLQRPLWYGPIAMSLVEITPILSGIVLVLLPVRNLVMDAVMMYVLFYCVMLSVVIVIRMVWGHMSRVHFAADMQLRQTRDVLRAESQRLIDVLQAMMPNRVAATLVKRDGDGRDRRQPRTYVSRGTLVTSTVDQGFGLIQFDKRRTTHGGSAQWIEDVTRIHEEMMSQVPGGSVITNGDVFFVTMDDSQHHTLPMGVGCATVVRALLRCRSMLLPTMRARAYLGACPMMGGLVGRRSATFEWYAPEVEAALQLIQMGAERTPLEWGMMVCSTRFLYHLRQSLASARDATFVVESQWSEAVRWRVQGIGTLDVALFESSDFV